jgi:hypothetical protein
MRPTREPGGKVGATKEYVLHKQLVLPELPIKEFREMKLRALKEL